MADNLFNPNEDSGIAEDASEVSANPFDGFGNRMPGAPTWEKYNVNIDPGNEPVSHVPFGMDERIDQIPVGSDMGSMSVNVGMQRLLDNLYNSDARNLFGENGDHMSGPDNMRGSDSMEGIAGLDGFRDGTLRDEDMYLSQQEPFPGIEKIAHPLLPFNPLPRSLNVEPENSDE